MARGTKAAAVKGTKATPVAKQTAKQPKSSKPAPAAKKQPAPVAKKPSPVAKKQPAAKKSAPAPVVASETESSDDADDEDDEEEEQEDSDDDGFEDQGSSSEDESEAGEEDEEEDNLTEAEKRTRRFTVDREAQLQKMREDGSLQVASQLHIDDLSSDDEVRLH